LTISKEINENNAEIKLTEGIPEGAAVAADYETLTVLITRSYALKVTHPHTHRSHFSKRLSHKRIQSITT